MEQKICLDTDVLITFLRNKKEEVKFILEQEERNEITTTYINLFELYYGAYKSKEQQKNLEAVNLIIDRITILNLTLLSVKKAGEILAQLEREGEKVDFRDILIGTIALLHNCILKTNNTKHFSKIEGLKLVQ